MSFFVLIGPRALSPLLTDRTTLKNPLVLVLVHMEELQTRPASFFRRFVSEIFARNPVRVWRPHSRSTRQYTHHTRCIRPHRVNKGLDDRGNDHIGDALIQRCNRGINGCYDMIGHGICCSLGTPLPLCTTSILYVEWLNSN